MKFIPNREIIKGTLMNQLDSFWAGLYDKEIVGSSMDIAFGRMESNLCQSNISRFRNKEECVFSIYDTTQWSIFLYYLANILGEIKCTNEASVVYYLNKVMHSVDWYYEIQLPVHFMVEHPVGSILGRAEYGDYFVIYQGVTVGGNRKANKIDYPIIGNNVLLYSNSSILGNTTIGNNVIVSAGSLLLNEKIPDNCIVFGRSPDIIIKEKSEDFMKEKTIHIWDWNRLSP